MIKSKPGSIIRLSAARAVAAVAIAALLAFAPVAAAQSPTDAQYGSSTKIVEKAAGGDPGKQEAAGGQLPFTGGDAVTLAVVALSLVVAGFGLRRFALSR